MMKGNRTATMKAVKAVVANPTYPGQTDMALVIIHCLIAERAAGLV
jgi:hypothetical protein